MNYPPLPEPARTVDETTGKTPRGSRVFKIDCYFTASQMQAYVDADRAQRIPEGYVLVPVEPTEKMIAAAHESDRQYTLRNFGDVMTVQQGPWDHWAAMIAAAPKVQP